MAASQFPKFFGRTWEPIALLEVLDCRAKSVCAGEEQNINLERAEATSTADGLPSVPMIRIWRTIRGYILWSHERGTLQYDVMVTLILIFVFLSPYWIGFRDKPIQRAAHPTSVSVLSDGHDGFIYEIEGSAVRAKEDNEALRTELRHVIEPISGEVSIAKVEVVRDRKGQVLTYRVWAQRE
jgi:hypothetical protein